MSHQYLKFRQYQMYLKYRLYQKYHQYRLFQQYLMYQRYLAQFTQLQTLQSSGNTAVTVETVTGSGGDGFTCIRTIADVRTDMKEITLAAPWRGHDGRPQTARLVTRYGRNGLYDFFYTAH